jgi:hypothetical protein
MYVNVGAESNNADAAAVSIYDFFARGDRESGNTLIIYNFNEADYYRDPVNGGFVPVGDYHLEGVLFTIITLCV